MQNVIAALGFGAGDVVRAGGSVYSTKAEYEYGDAIELSDESSDHGGAIGPGVDCYTVTAGPR